MEYLLKIGPQGHIYLPKIVRDSFGDRMKFFPDEIAGVIYSEDAKLEDVLATIEVIVEHLKLMQRKEAVQ